MVKISMEKGRGILDLRLKFEEVENWDILKAILKFVPGPVRPFTFFVRVRQIWSPVIASGSAFGSCCLVFCWLSGFFWTVFWEGVLEFWSMVSVGEKLVVMGSSEPSRLRDISSQQALSLYG